MDNLPDFIITYLPIVIATITGIIGTGLGVYNFIQRQKDRRPTLGTFQRKKENGIWFIHIHSPSKPIRKCNVTFKGQHLLIRGGISDEKTVPLGGGVNFDMPNDVSDNDDGMVLVKSGKRTLEKPKFNEIEIG